MKKKDKKLKNNDNITLNLAIMLKKFTMQRILNARGKNTDIFFATKS